MGGAITTSEYTFARQNTWIESHMKKRHTGVLVEIGIVEDLDKSSLDLARDGVELEVASDEELTSHEWKKNVRGRVVNRS